MVTATSLLLASLVDKRLVNVGNDAAACNGGLQWIEI